jgi:hypothetical protein
LKASTRRGYVQAFKGLHQFLQVRKAVEIDAAFGVRLTCPVDEFNASRHVSDDSPEIGGAGDTGESGGVLRVLEDPDRDRPQVRPRGSGLRLVPDLVSRRAAG